MTLLGLVVFFMVGQKEGIDEFGVASAEGDVVPEIC